MIAHIRRLLGLRRRRSTKLSPAYSKRRVGQLRACRLAFERGKG